MRTVFENSPGPVYFVQVPKMFHLNLTDVSLLIWAPFAKMIGLLGPVDARRAHRIVNAYTVAFFARHLRGQPAPLLDRPTSRYPDVRFDSRTP